MKKYLYLEKYLSKLIKSLKNQNYKKYYDVHFYRYLNSYIYLNENNLLNKNYKILEIGSKTLFADLIKRFNQKIQIDSTHPNDLIYPFADKMKDKYDIILCMEVIEHIKDQESDELKDKVLFNESGINNLLSECNKLLKKDGKIFITTPNVNSYRSIVNLLYSGHPYNFKPHVRELSISDLKRLLKNNNLITENIKFIDSWKDSMPNKNIIKIIDKALEKLKIKNIKREDNIFILAKK